MIKILIMLLLTNLYCATIPEGVVKCKKICGVNNYTYEVNEYNEQICKYLR